MDNYICKGIAFSRRPREGLSTNRKTGVIVRRVSLERTSGKVRASRFSRDAFSKTMTRATDRYRSFYLFVLISLSLRSIKIIAIPYLATRDSSHPLSKFRNDPLFCMGFVIPGFVIPDLFDESESYGIGGSISGHFMRVALTRPFKTLTKNIFLRAHSR